MRGVVRGENDIWLSDAAGNQLGGFTRQVDGSAGQVNHNQQSLVAKRAGERIYMRVIRINQPPLAAATIELLWRKAMSFL